MNEVLRQKRLEFNRGNFKQELRAYHGEKCANCGSKENVEYHHIVPLVHGGTNNIGNIVPLCRACHDRVHYGVVRGFQGKGGRPRQTFNKEQQVYFWLYFHNQIGKKALMEGIGTTNSKITCHPWYEEMKQKCHAPEDFYNNIDLLNAKRRNR